MSSIAKRPNGKWRARYRDVTGKEHARHFDRKVDATRFLEGVTSAMVTGTYVDPERSRVTVGEWSARYLAAQHHLKPSTRARYEGIVRRHVLPAWGTVPLSAVTHADVAAWTASLTLSGLSPASVRYTHRVLSLVLGLAVRDGRLPRNPADGTPMPRPVAHDKRFLSSAQVASLASAAGPYGTAIKVLAFCGLRFGELAALRVRRVDLLRRRLDIAESVAIVAGKAVFSTPKTHSTRSVPLPRTVADELAQQMAGKDADDFVFPAPGGGVLRIGNFRKRTFDPACRAAGLEGLTPHELRHTAASLAVAAGGNVKVVQRMLGHASAAMTLDVYAGLFTDDLEGMADRLDGIAADSLRTQASSARQDVHRTRL